MLTFFSRTAKYAFQDFWRNIWLSLITTTVILIALFCLNSLLLIKTVSEHALQTIEEKIDVSVFINPGVQESSVLDLRARLLSLPEVKEVLYVSPEEALALMVERHGNDPAITLSLEELDSNPLGAQLIVQAQSTKDYDPIVALLADERYQPIVADKNFDEHTDIIERVSIISQQVRSFATVLSVIFALIALIVVFNTLRIIIYTHREEIAIMRLVGATNWFIRMPYLWQGVLYSVLSLGIFLLAWYPLVGFLQPYVNELFADTGNVDLLGFYNRNFLVLFGTQLLALIVLLGLASILATRKYSKV
jgi:cell division transport system permease protein